MIDINGDTMVCCSNCKFWEEFTPENVNGNCHVEPPKISDKLVSKEHYPEFVGIFPMTPCDTWCGKFHAKE